MFAPAASPTTRRSSGNASTTASVLRPTEPVLPRMEILRMVALSGNWVLVYPERSEGSPEAPARVMPVRGDPAGGTGDPSLRSGWIQTAHPVMMFSDVAPCLAIAQ